MVSEEATAMSTVSMERDSGNTNPLDLLEEIVSANEWAFQRTGEDEILVSLAGRWCDYQLHFGWCGEVSALQFACSLDMRVPAEKRAPVSELLALINGRMWIGHFDLGFEEGTPAFRQTVLLRGAEGSSVEQLEDLMDIGIIECERFYPAFQFIIWAGKSARDAIEAAMLDTVGEA
jgi:hypothetical protein